MGVKIIIVSIDLEMGLVIRKQSLKVVLLM